MVVGGIVLPREEGRNDGGRIVLSREEGRNGGWRDSVVKGGREE